MFTIKVTPDKSETNQPQYYLVKEFFIEEDKDKLTVSLITKEAYSIFRERLDTHNRAKRLATVKLNFKETLAEDKLSVVFDGDIRHSLFFLIEFGTISQEAYKDAISKLNNISFKIVPNKQEITPFFAKKFDEIRQLEAAEEQKTGYKKNRGSEHTTVTNK